MEEWKKLKVDGVPGIERCVAEFKISELAHIPFESVKVKIFNRDDNLFVGFINLRVNDPIEGYPEGGAGYGTTILEALEDTLKYFSELLEGREHLRHEDFEWWDPTDF